MTPQLSKVSKNGRPMLPLPQEGQQVSADTLVDLAASFLRQAGLPGQQAEEAARLLVEAQRAGQNSHGLTHLPAYLNGILTGAINPRPRFQWVESHPTSHSAAAILDADNGLGVLAARAACLEAVDRAKAQGICAVAVRRSSHFGAAGAFVSLMAQQCVVGLALSNASATVAPWGSKEAKLGTNPLAAAFPRKGLPPLIIDLATTAGSRGRIRQAQRNGQSIPKDWALDSNGVPTTDPNQALQGTMQPLGGAKGYALGLIIELLCAGLSGGLAGSRVLSPHDKSGQPAGTSHFFLAIDTAAFGGAERVAEAVFDITSDIKNAAPISADAPVRLPGAGSQAARDLSAAKGIRISKSLAGALSQASLLAQQLASKVPGPAPLQEDLQ
ncbi:Ldh family oxidoreductase [Rhodovibrionaceae bacterium A322]